MNDVLDQNKHFFWPAALRRQSGYEKEKSRIRSNAKLSVQGILLICPVLPSKDKREESETLAECER